MNTSIKNIYWNTQKIKTLERILDILSKESPELLFLSELEPTILDTWGHELHICGYEHFRNPGCERVHILKKQNINIALSIQHRYYTAVYITNIDTYAVSVHLPSLRFQHPDALKEFIRDFRTTLDSQIGASSEKRIYVIGDFNVNPFEKPMIDFDGFMATNSTNARTEITHLSKRRISYYNPTWQLYARKHFPGTKYFKRPSVSSYDIIEHHYLDQVVISQKLKEHLHSERIDVIEFTNKFTFFNSEENIIEGSDHLPLLYEFNIS